MICWICHQATNALHIWLIAGKDRGLCDLCDAARERKLEKAR